MLPHTVLLAVAVWTAWRPSETVAATPVVVALAVLLLVPWAHRRTARDRLAAAAVAAVLVFLMGAASAVSGWDLSTAVSEAALAIAVMALAWLASRESPPGEWPRWLALGIAALSLWALWQVAVGFDRAQDVVTELPEAMRVNAAERLASGRAFASLLLPGHLAVMLATALPLLASKVRRSPASIGWLAGCLLCVIGLILTQSPIGIALGVGALVIVAGRRRSWVLYGGAAALITGLVMAFLFRGDLVGLEPLSLRLDNWRTATWLWATSPVTGVGFGSFGQACQTVPFAVGNRPLHAHSLPFEWIAELGIVGVFAVAIAVLWLVGLLRRVWPHHPELAVAVAVVPLHNMLDFSLYTSGVAVPWAVLLGWAAAVARPPSSAVGAGGSRIVLVGCAALAVAASMLHSTSVVVERSGAAAAHPADRFDSGLRAHRLAPWRVGPAFVTAAAALDEPTAERLRLSAGVVQWGRRLRPHSAAMAAMASRIELARGRIPSAVADAWSAARDRPSSREHREALDQLLQRLVEAEGAAGR